MKLHTIISFTCQDLTTLETFVKSECMDSRISLQTAKEILRMIKELDEKLLNAMEQASKQLEQTIILESGGS